MIWQSSSSAATKKFGAEYAARLLRRGPRRRATVIGLVGELGSGKTTFVQGFFRGARARGRAVSPTFVIMRRAVLRRRGFKDLYHVDAYRLRRIADLRPLGFEDILARSANVVLVEWADRLRRALPKETHWFVFRHGPTPTCRMIKIGEARGRK